MTIDWKAFAFVLLGGWVLAALLGYIVTGHWALIGILALAIAAAGLVGLVVAVVDKPAPALAEWAPGERRELVPDRDTMPGPVIQVPADLVAYYQAPRERVYPPWDDGTPIDSYRDRLEADAELRLKLDGARTSREAFALLVKEHGAEEVERVITSAPIHMRPNQGETRRARNKPAPWDIITSFDGLTSGGGANRQRWNDTTKTWEPWPGIPPAPNTEDDSL